MFHRKQRRMMFAVTKIQIFESNSQQSCICKRNEQDVRRHKDTNFWKQFTTNAMFQAVEVQMFAVTKIQIFESNSQQSAKNKNRRPGCSPSQRYKFLKAIHNQSFFLLLRREDVRRHKDTNFWKQFTTKSPCGCVSLPMFAVTKIQIFESNSQRAITPSIFLFDVRRHKDTNFWKQFTTRYIRPYM